MSEGPRPELAPVSLRPFRRSEVGDFVGHLRRGAAESGKDGAPHFAPRPDFDPEELRARIERESSAALDEPGWLRAWLAWAPDPTSLEGKERVIGHVDLRGGRLAAELHRSSLGLGIERAFWRRGLGERLCRAAIDWAHEQGHLTWVDLFVFAENAPARALYRKLGFDERGTVEDAFRLQNGAIVGDVRMVMKLR